MSYLGPDHAKLRPCRQARSTIMGRPDTITMSMQNWIAAGSSRLLSKSSDGLARRREARHLEAPNLFTVIEGDPFAVADAVGAREDFGIVQRKGRVRRGPVMATR